jgi:hypothetical protein
VHPDEVPTLKGDRGILDYTHELGAVGVTQRTVHYAVVRREIIPTRLGNANWFSRRDVQEWLRSRKQPEPSRFVGVNANRTPKATATP